MSSEFVQDPGTMMSLIMPDGRVVPLTADGNINETDDDLDVTTDDDLNTNSLLSHQINYDQWLEKVTCLKCRLCKHLSESREEMIEHLKDKHEEDITADDSKAEELVPENDITGLSFVLNDTESVSSVETPVNNFRTVIVQHKSNNQLQGGFLCGGCSKLFASEHDIAEHLSSSDTCSTSSSNNTNILQPSRTVYKKSKVVPVVINSDNNTENNSEARKIALNNRLKLELDYETRVIPCPVKGCNFYFKSFEMLKYHRTCHNSDSPDFKCLECEEKFDKWRDCSTHLWKIHNFDCDLFVCGVCKTYKTMYPRLLEAHCQTHSNLKLFKCDVCNKRFNQLSQLKNHVVTHLDKTIAEIPGWAKPKHCDICQKRFSDTKSLKKHVKEIHSKLRPYICNVCNHKSARKAMLQLHMRQHTGDKPFSCDYCDYKTGDQNSLRRHIKRHTGVKPYKCPYCPYGAIQSSTFRSHVKSKHPDQPEVDLKGCHATEMSQLSDPKQSSDLLILVDLDKTGVREDNIQANDMKYDQVVISGNQLEMSEPLNM